MLLSSLLSSWSQNQSLSRFPAPQPISMRYPPPSSPTSVCLSHFEL